MSNRRNLTPALSPRHHFGSEVRRAREAAGMTLADLGAMVPCDPSTVSRVEAGAIAPDSHFAEVCDEAFPDMNGWFARFLRQAVVLRDDAPRGWWVIDEFVLSRRVGSAGVMYDALTHLVEMSRRPRVCVQILVDGGGYVGLQGSFSIAERAGARSTVFAEDIAQGHVTDDGATVATVVEHFRWLQVQALSPGASTDFIERMAEEKWSTP